MVRPPRQVDEPTYEIVGAVERYDQRDHPNARFVLMPGTDEYEDYYSRHPELKEWDDENRRIGAAVLKRNRERDPVNQQFRPSAFYGRHVLAPEAVVEGLTESAIAPSGVPERVNVDPEEMSRKIKAYGKYLGAAKVGIARLKQEWVLTNYAYPFTPEPYGKPVELDYEYIVCMAVTQTPRMINCGVKIANQLETGWKYAYASLVSVVMAHFIRGTGWRARALPSENSPYLVVPAFVDAGIGEQGRCSYVVTKEFGNSFRPGAVATDMPLAIDKPVDFGLQDFCERCLLCAEYCPSGAITYGGKDVIRGVKRWPLHGDKCRRYWDQIGGSCTICHAVCPWNHPNNLLHDTVREMAERFPITREFFIKGDKLIYGKYKPAPEPWWISTKGFKEKTGGTGG